ncbi:hypothetical protein E1J38_008295 [Seonamhaeicola sediminis]|uniref:Uncharacterized protein n=1 Tax=Seonamhaeicola sediminis TaxID=2528206 RepID=A0A562YE14_9FLAO|nr:hypothetical protein [Seonamhaeicola sediminis]TWO32855.1 hypothetical protein E1J38_008295 [Seonamhaeicola sediminis]
MKTIKKTLLLICTLCFFCNISYAQKYYQVHQDNVMPSKIWDYEKIAKEFHAACVEHNPQTTWLCATMDDMRYLYVSPMENFADLDERPFADMAKAMGDKFSEMFKKFDQCYGSHGDYIIVLDEELTYMPDGISQTQEGQDYRDYYFIYYKPKNGKNVREGMKAVKEMFAAKGSKSHYRVYRTGFGAMESYYMVAMSSKDAIDSANKQKTNEELLGPDRFETFKKVMDYATKMEEVTGEIRRDLSYAPKEE